MPFRKGSSYILVVCIIITLVSRPLTASDRNITGLYSKHAILDFTRHLIAQKEYYRAYVEIQRLKSYYPGFISAEQAHISELHLLFLGNQFSAIRTSSYTGTNPLFIQIDQLYKFDAGLYRDDGMPTNLADSCMIGALTSEIDSYIGKRILLARLLSNNYTSDQIGTAQTRLLKNAIGADSFNKLLAFSAERVKEYKDQNIAALWGIIPGAGYAYAGNTPTGILAAIVISIFSTLTYFSFRTNNPQIGVFLGAATGFFYGGSILGGYLQAKRHNASVYENLKDDLVQEMNLQQDREALYKRYGIAP